MGRGQDRMRPLWRHYFDGTDALIFVVDSNDHERIADARDELNMMLDEQQLRDAILLVFANKMDLPNAMTAGDVTEQLGLYDVRDRSWYVQSSSVTSGAGLNEGIGWLSNELKGK